MADFEAESRKEAQACGRVGFVGFARAFNATSEGDTPWRYSAEVLEQFETLCGELLHLIKTGEIEVNPSHTQYAAARAARNDPAIQSLIRKASRKTPIRAKKA